MKSGVILMWGESMWNNAASIKNREAKMHWTFTFNTPSPHKNKHTLFKFNYSSDLSIIPDYILLSTTVCNKFKKKHLFCAFIIS